MSSFIAFWFNFRWRGIDAGEEYPAANPLPDAAGAIRVLQLAKYVARLSRDKVNPLTTLSSS